MCLRKGSNVITEENTFITIVPSMKCHIYIYHDSGRIPPDQDTPLIRLIRDLNIRTFFALNLAHINT